MSNKSKLIEHYKDEADGFDNRREICKHQKFYNKLHSEIVYSYLKGCKNVYEAGCGTGRFTLYLAKKGIKVHAMDSSEKMISIAKKKAIKEGVNKNITFEIGDIENIKSNDNIYDGVLSIAVLRHFKNINKGISELSRIAKPKGVVVTDYLDKKYYSIYRIYRKLIKDKNEKYFYPNYYRTLTEIRNIFQNNGLDLTSHKSIRKFPKYLFYFKFLNSALNSIENNINMGPIVTVKGIKK